MADTKSGTWLGSIVTTSERVERAMSCAESGDEVDQIYEGWVLSL